MRRLNQIIKMNQNWNPAPEKPANVKVIEKRDSAGLLHGWQHWQIRNSEISVDEMAHYNHGQLVYSRIIKPETIHIRAFKNGQKVKDTIKARARKPMDALDVTDGIDGMIYDDMTDHADIVSQYRGMTSFNQIMG